MNKPDCKGYQALIEYEGKWKWANCPYCGKRNFPISTGAVILGQVFKCKNSKCKQYFEVNIDDRSN